MEHDPKAWPKSFLKIMPETSVLELNSFKVKSLLSSGKEEEEEEEEVG